MTLLLVLNVLGLIQVALINVTGVIVTEFEAPIQLLGPQPPLLGEPSRGLSFMTVTAHINDPTAAQTVLGLLANGLAFAVATLPMIIMARRLVDQAVAGDPFTVAVATGLRRLGRLILLGGLIAEVVSSAAAYALYDSVLPSDGAINTIMIDFWWLLLGLVVLSFAQIMRHGCALRTELDEVI
jgi:hypothetical protein